MMRILLLSFEFPPETGFGGIGTYAWYHARALARLGHSVHVLAGATAPTALRTTETYGVRVHRFRAGGAAMSAFRALGRMRWWWTKNRLENALSMSRGLNELLRTYDYDIIEMPECGAEGSLINGRIDIPTVVRAHSPARLIMPFYPVPRGDIATCSWIEQRGIDNATALSSCSRFLAEEMRSRMAVRAPIRVITNGIDLSLFDGEAQTDGAPTLPNDVPTVFFAGRMEERKGIQLCGAIVAAVLARHDAAFIFAGDDLFGTMRQSILPSIERMGLKRRVRYLGKLNQDDVRSCMRQADIVLLPSLWENCPYSCLEAMAASRAIVCSNQGGMPELICDEVSGLLASAGDVTMFARQLGRLIEDVTLRRRLGREARATMDREHRDEHVARLSVAFYEECVKIA